MFINFVFGVEDASRAIVHASGQPSVVGMSDTNICSCGLKVYLWLQASFVTS